MGSRMGRCRITDGLMLQSKHPPLCCKETRNGMRAGDGRMAYLEVENATKVYGERVRALDGVSVSIGQDEFFTLLGPSGCGKTTLLRAIAGFLDLTGGHIRLAG